MTTAELNDNCDILGEKRNNKVNNKEDRVTSSELSNERFNTNLPMLFQMRIQMYILFFLSHKSRILKLIINNNLKSRVTIHLSFPRHS